jgi:hypothetical protein
MAYASDPLYRLGIVARNAGVVVAGMSVVGIFGALYNPERVADPKTAYYIAIFGLAPATLMVVLSFPARRGHLWAVISLLLVSLWQLPSLLYLSCGCCFSWVPAYFIAQCVISMPEVTFQIRAARRQRRGYGDGQGHGFEPIMDARPNADGASPMTPPPPPRSTPVPPPRSLKPGGRKPGT